jgi:ribosomal protein S18 acetylase RimI-like enzyme
MDPFRLLASAEDIRPAQLAGFFEGWPAPPTAERHLQILRASSYLLLAMDGDVVAGFITAITDDVFAASIPLLEVRPEYRGHRLGTRLVREMLARLGHCYMIDLICDPDVLPFYEQLGMTPYSGAIIRNRPALG